MELDEMKLLWEEMSQDLDNQKKLTDKIIIEMTNERYLNKMRSISGPETIGGIVCFGMALFLLFNFGKLDTWYLILSGVFTLGFLTLLPFFSLRSIYIMRHINMADGNMKETLLDFSKARNQFLLIQRLGVILSFVLVITSLPVASKILNGTDIFTKPAVLSWYIPAGFIFLFFFGRWGYNCYVNITNSAENLLKELEA